MAFLPLVERSNPSSGIEKPQNLLELSGLDMLLLG